MPSQIEVDDIVSNKYWTNGICRPNFKCYSTTTDAQGKYSIDYSSDNYASVSYVTPMVVNNASEAKNEYIATIHQFDNDSASGAVIKPGNLLIAPDYVGSGVEVKLLVLSDPNA